jgi:hypothetical protein
MRLRVLKSNRNKNLWGVKRQKSDKSSRRNRKSFILWVVRVSGTGGPRGSIISKGQSWEGGLHHEGRKKRRTCMVHFVIQQDKAKI